MSDYPPPPGPPPPPGSGGSTPPPPPPPPGGGGGWGSAPPPPPPGPGGGGTQFPSGPAGYTVGNAVNYGFKKFTENWIPLIVIALLLIFGAAVVQFIGNAITNALTSDTVVDPNTLEVTNGGLLGFGLVLSLLFSALSFVVNLVVQSGIIKLALGITRGQKVDLGTAFAGVNWPQVFLAAIVIGALTFVGLVLCILPGLLVVIFTSYTMFFVLDRDQDAITAIRSSVTFVRDNFGQLFLFWLASVALYIVGACLCGVGLLAAIPTVLIAQAYTFRTLTNDPVTA